MDLEINTKEYITKCALVEIMKNLLDKNLIKEDDRYSLQFCIDQHKYKLENQQENGFNKEALFDTFQTLCEVFGLDVDYDGMLTLEFN